MSAAGGNRRGRATRQRILPAPDTCSERQALDLTPYDVAREAATTRMTVHRHTGGREALVTQVVLRASSVLAEAITAVLGDDRRPFGPRLVDALALTVERIRATPHLLGLFAPASVEAGWPQVDPDERVLRVVHEFFGPYFDAAGAAGELRADPASSLDWILSQVLLYLMVPGVAPDDAEVRRQLETFAVPAIIT